MPATTSRRPARLAARPDGRRAPRPQPPEGAGVEAGKIRRTRMPAQSATDLPRRLFLGAAGAIAAGAVPGWGATGSKPSLDLVASFPGRQVTGVAVAPNGRIFVNFPRWEADVPISVAEVGANGALTPYPDAAWNSFRDAAPAAADQRFVCVQSVTCDPKGNLWVLDPAAPGLSFEVSGGPK